MNPFQRPPITDELLSAYLDGAVTVEEKSLIEKTVKNDASVAWRLESLRQTVALLRALPDLPLPRSFLLTEADVAPQTAPVPPIVAAARRSRPVSRAQAEHNSFWQSLVNFFQGGSPLLRNLATAGLTVWIILFGVTSQLDVSRNVLTSILSQDRSNVMSQTRAVASASSTEEVAIAQVSATEPTKPLASESIVTSNAITSAPSDEQNAVANDSNQASANAEMASPKMQVLVMEPSAESSARIADTASENIVSANDSSEAASLAQIGVGQQPSADASELFAEAQRDISRNEVSANEVAAASAAPAFAAEVSEDAVSASAASITNNEKSNPLADSDANIHLNSAPQPFSAEISAQNPAPNTPLAQPSEPATPALPAEATATLTIAAPIPVVEAPLMLSDTQTSVSQAELPAQIETQMLEPTEEAVEVALGNPQTNDTEFNTQIRDTQQDFEGVSTPILDPIRLQLAQFAVAMVTAVLALFWLASQSGKRKR